MRAILPLLRMHALHFRFALKMVQQWANVHGLCFAKEAAVQIWRQNGILKVWQLENNLQNWRAGLKDEVWICLFLLNDSWLTMLCLIFTVQHSDSVRYTHTHTHTHTYSFPLWLITGYWTEFPVLYNKSLLFIHSIYNSLYLLIPKSYSFPPLWQP